MSCPAFRQPPQASGHETNIIPLFPKNKIRFSNFSVAIVPLRPKKHYRQRRTSWRIFPLRSMRSSGVRVEKFAFKSFTGPVFSRKRSSNSGAYRLVCLSTFFQVLEPSDAKLS
jgi:hypothetical protein